ncbi:alpha/beta hydrolase [Mycobacterium sp. TY815]|uniref:alpha/beta hydrolase n=1 Tax=Mycobacterium sp. TY815 TaxID=3050581 RepID=UPI00274199CF|nr:alpha/beta hydrolase [Mycobacterium sp. TY815]MDP7705846.1 alpha/beta hydrolase [Mycobacterium sp. TY815]
MTLTLADIERWDPAAITTVFDAAIKRAHGTRTTSAVVTELMRLLAFGGDAADAARAATGQTMLVLDDHADACAAVAHAAEQSAEEVGALKQQLQAMREGARQSHLVIDEAVAMALPPSNLPAFTAAQQEAILDAAVRLTEGLRRLLADAERADEDLAAAIRGAEGDLHADRVESQLSHRQPSPPQLPAPDAAPAAVATWWHALTPWQQDRARQNWPDALRNRDGIPATVRNELNIPVLQRELDRLRQGWIDSYGWHTDPGALADLTALHDSLAENPDAGLLLLDTAAVPGKVLAAVAIGDVDNAERIGVTVNGLTTRVSASTGKMVREARFQRDEARLLRSRAGVAHPDAVASIAWLGYDAPDSLRDVGHDWLARDGARALNSFYRGLAAAGNTAEPGIAAFGHSYGSVTTSLAVQQGAPVSDVVLYGSPGAELTDASQLGVPRGHAYYMVGTDDIVSELIPGLRAFGAAPQEVPGMTELSANTGYAMDGRYGDGQLHERAYGHSEYAEPGSNGNLRMSAYNLAVVLAGLPKDLITPVVAGMNRRPG